jgi:D-glycero-alpha-D-manno-heptose-7-phosphate kinase
MTGNGSNSMLDEQKLSFRSPAPREGVGFRAAISVGSRASDDVLTRRVSIRSRAPLRLGLAGGGTDLSPYCDEFGGAILNATIGRYAYAHLSFRDDGFLCFSAHDAGQEDVTPAADKVSLDKGLLLHRAVFNRITHDFFNGRVCPVNVSSVVDAPTGSGLGASSALVVAMVEAYRSAFGLPLGRYDVARLAYEIERIDLGLAGGRQDQYAAAFGGINFIEFLPGDRTIVNPLRIPPAYLSELEASLLICFTGQARASAIIQDQVKGVITNDPAALEAMHCLKADAIDMKHALLEGDIRHVAQILNRSWQSKQRTSRLVSNASIEGVFDLGLKNGAVAGKVSGAGGGGFLMFMTDPEQRHRLVSALNEAGVAAASVQFTEGGVQAWVTNC